MQRQPRAASATTATTATLAPRMDPPPSWMTTTIVKTRMPLAAVIVTMAQTQTTPRVQTAPNHSDASSCLWTQMWLRVHGRLLLLGCPSTRMPHCRYGCGSKHTIRAASPVLSSLSTEHGVASVSVATPPGEYLLAVRRSLRGLPGCCSTTRSQRLRDVCFSVRPAAMCWWFLVAKRRLCRCFRAHTLCSRI